MEDSRLVVFSSSSRLRFSPTASASLEDGIGSMGAVSEGIWDVRVSAAEGSSSTEGDVIGSGLVETIEKR